MMFSCRIVTTDHYQSSPLDGLDLTYSDFWNAPIDSVPILRIYGITPAGQKTCMHIHGVSLWFLVLFYLKYLCYLQTTVLFHVHLSVCVIIIIT